MNFAQNLLAARHHIVVILGVCVSTALIAALDGSEANSGAPRATVPHHEVPATRHRPLTAGEVLAARTAWRYFENNTQPTGLANSADKYPAATLWDSSSYLLAVIAAYRLGIITREQFDARISAAFAALTALPLFDGKLPNKSFNTISLAMVDYNNRATTRGIGWSAIDVGRILVPIDILVWQYPQHTERARKLLATWSFSSLVKDGYLQGAALNANNGITLQQEGRLGYEGYAAKSLALMGLDVSVATRPLDNIKYVKTFGVPVPADSREPEKYHAHNYVTSEPYMLDGLEYGWDHTSADLAFLVFDAQRARYLSTGTLTAVTEDNIDEKPYFVYNTVYSSGKSWNTITDNGADASDHRSLSVKAAFAWHALYDNDYTAKLFAFAAPLADPNRGYFAGWYEAKQRPNRAITCNTNAIILESLAYRAFGPSITSTAVPVAMATATGTRHE